MKALLVYVAPLTVEMLPDCAAMTRDLSVGTAELVIDVDVEVVLVVVADTLVILPPDTVIETATDPYWWVTVGPANVPFLNPLAGAVVAGAAVVAFAVVAAVVALAAVVAAAAVVPAFVADTVVPGLLAAELAARAAALVAALVAALDAAADVWAATAADAAAVVGVALASVAAPEADGSSVVSDVGSAATAGAPIAVAPPSVAADHAAARMPADVTTAATLPRALTRRTSRYGSRSSAYRPSARPR
jgi:hypothetical protein